MGSMKRLLGAAAVTLSLLVLLPATASAWSQVGSKGKPGKIAVQKVVGVHIDPCTPNACGFVTPALSFRAPIMWRSPATRQRQKVSVTTMIYANGGSGWQPVRKYNRAKVLKRNQKRVRTGQPISMINYSTDSGQTWNWLPGGLKWQVRMTFNWRSPAGRFLGQRRIHLKHRGDYLCPTGGQCAVGKWIWLS